MKLHANQPKHPLKGNLQFQGAEAALAKPIAQSAAKSFEGALKNSIVPKAGKLNSALDFKNLGDTSVNMIKMIYGAVIVSRSAAAATRSWNELREAAVRDSMGYTFWLFLVPMLQRLMLLSVRDEKYKKALIKELPKPEGSGLKATLQKINRLNPISRYKVVSSQEIQDWQKQVLDHLKNTGRDEATDIFKNTEKYFAELLKKRRIVTGVGFAITIGVIGVGINLFNMAMTKRKVEQGKVGKY